MSGIAVASPKPGDSSRADDLYDEEKATDPTEPMPTAAPFDAKKSAEQLRLLLVRYLSKSSDDAGTQETRGAISRLVNDAIAAGKELELGAEFDRHYKEAAMFYAEKGRDLPLGTPLRMSHDIFSNPDVTRALSGLFFDPGRWVAVQREAEARHDIILKEVRSVRDARRLELMNRGSPTPEITSSPDRK